MYFDTVLSTLIAIQIADFLVCLLLLWQNTDKTNLGQERVYLVYTSHHSPQMEL